MIAFRIKRLTKVSERTRSIRIITCTWKGKNQKQNKKDKQYENGTRKRRGHARVHATQLAVE